MGAGFDIARRRFIQASAAVGGGLLLGFYLPGTAHAAPTEAVPSGRSAYPPAKNCM